MSLQVWLPLDGDLRNQGLDGSAVLSNPSATWGTGKIAAKAYLTNTGTNEATFQNLIGVKEFSIAYWLKIDSSLTYNAYQDFWQVYYTNKTGTGPIRDEHTNVAGGHQLLVYKETNVGSNTNGYWGCSVNGANNVWVHIVLTKDATQTKTYCDGVLKQTQNNTVYESSTGALTGKIRIGLATCGAYLNDFRIYDHCLSYKEVSELAKGLILHYRLSKPLPNLLKNSTFNNTQNWGGVNGSSISTIVYDEKKCLTGTKGTSNNLFCQTTNINYTAGTIQKYKFSALIYSPASATIQANIWINSGGWKSIGNVSFDNGTSLNEGWNYVTATITANNSSYSGQIIFSLGTSGTTIYLTYPKIEEGEKITNFIPNESDTLYSALGYNSDIELDCAPAGNQNDGTIVGTITAAADSPRYESSYQFVNSDGAIKIGNLSTICPEKIFTFNIWFKKETGKWSSKNWETILGGPSGFELEGRVGTTPYIHPYSWGGGSTSTANSYSIAYTLDEWHMLTMIRTTSDTKFYLDGEWKVTGSAGNIPSGDYFIGSWRDTTSQNFRGYISDARLYCTALSAEDIKELYDTAAQVDKDGNVYAYEFKEA